TEARHGRQLHVTDGTAAGTKQLSSVQSVSGYNLSDLTVVGSRAYFVVTYYDGQRDELWTSDGTAAGTHRVEGIDSSDAADGAIWRLTPVGDLVYFFRKNGFSDFQLWRSDGTEQGTLKLALIPGSFDNLDATQI